MSAMSKVKLQEVVRNKLAALEWGRIVADVRPFLDIGSDADLLTLESLTKLLE